MFWLSRLNNLVQQFAANGRVAFPHRNSALCAISPRRSERVHLWLERLEDRRVLDATAVFSAGVLVITGDAGVDTVDDISFSTDGISLFVHDGLNTLDVDDGGGGTTNVDLSSLTEIQINLGDGNDILNLNLPSVAAGATIAVNMGDGDDTTFVGVDIPDSSGVSISSDSIQFIGTTYNDVDFTLTGQLDLPSDLTLNTGGGDFLLTGGIATSGSASLEITLGGGNFSVSDAIGATGQELTTFTINAGSGNIGLANVFTTGNITLGGDEIALNGSLSGHNISATGNQIDLFGNLDGNDISLSGTTLVHNSLSFTADNDILLSGASLAPTADGLNLSFTAGNDITLGNVTADSDTGLIHFDDLTILSAVNVTTGSVDIDNLFEITSAPGDTILGGAITAGSVELHLNTLDVQSGIEVDTAGILIDATGVIDLSGATIATHGQALEIISAVTGASAITSDSGTVLTSDAAGAMFTLRPAVDSTSIDLGLSGSGDFRIDSALLGMVSGFDTIVVGSGTQSGTIRVVDAVTTGVGLTLNATGGDIEVNAFVDVTGTTTFIGDGSSTTLNADMSATDFVFNDSVLIGDDGDEITLTATNSIDFQMAVDSEASTNHSLVLNAATISTATAIGATDALNLLTVNGALSLGGSVTTAGKQTYTGAVTLTDSVELVSNGGDIEFQSTLDGVADYSQNLTLTAGTGNITFGDSVGGATDGKLGDVQVVSATLTTFSSTLDAASVDIASAADLGGHVTTTGPQSYNSILLTDNITLEGTTVQVNGGISGPHSLELNASGGTTITGTLGTDIVNVTVVNGALSAGTIDIDGNLDAGNTNAGQVTTTVAGITVGGTLTSNDKLESAAGLSVTGIAELGGDVMTVDGQTYLNGITLTSSVVLTAGGAIGVTGTVLGDGSGPYSLELDADPGTTISGALGSGAATDISTVTVSGGDLNAGSISIVGDLAASGRNVTATDAIDVDGNVSVHNLEAVTQGIMIGGMLSTTGTVDSGDDLFVTGTASIGGNVTSVNEQTYQSSVTLTSNVQFQADNDVSADGEGINFGSTVSGATFNLTIIGGAGFAGAASSTGALLAGSIDSESTLNFGSVSVTGAAELGGSVTTSGSQTYGTLSPDGLTLTDNVTLTSGSLIDVQGDVLGDGNAEYDLEFSATSGTTISGALADGTANGIDDVTVTAGNLQAGTINITGDLSASGHNVTAGSIDIDGGLTAQDVESTVGVIDVGTTLTARHVTAKTNVVAGTIDLTGDLAAVDVTSTGSIDAKTIDLTGDLEATGQDVTAESIDVEGYLTAQDVESTSGGIDVGTNLTARNVTTTGGGITVGGGLTTTGTIDSAAGLSVTGTAELGGSVTTSGSQTYSSGITLTSSVDLTANGASTIGVTGDVLGDGNASYNLGLAAANGISISGKLGDAANTTNDLNNVTIASGDLSVGSIDIEGILTGGNVTSTGSIDAKTIDLTGDLEATGQDVTAESIDVDGFLTARDVESTVGAIDVGTTLTARDVTAATNLAAGTISLTGNLDAVNVTTDIGGITVGGSLTSTGTINSAAGLSVTGTSDLGGDVTTVGEQVYSSAVTLTTNVQLQATDTDADDEGIDFGSTVTGGGFDLTITGGAGFAAAASGLGTLNADHIDTESTLGATSVSVTGTADLGGHVTTTATQSYGVLLLTSDVTLDGTDIDVTGSVNSEATEQNSLNVVASGTVTFGGAIGTAANGELGGLTVGTPAQFNLLGAVEVVGDVDLNGAAISIDDNITTTGSGNVTITNSGLLTIANNSVFNLAGAFLQDGTGAVELGGDITTDDAAITWTGAVTLTDSVQLSTGTGAGNIQFLSTLDGTTNHTENLTLTAGTGNIAFDLAVGSSTPLGALQVNSANDVTFSGSVAAASIVQSAGTGTTTFSGSVTTSTATGLQVTTENIVVQSTISSQLTDLRAADTITLPDAGLDVGTGVLKLKGDVDIVDSSGRDLGPLVASELTFVSGSQGGNTQLATNVDKLTVDMTTAFSGTKLTVLEQDAVEIVRIETNDGDVDIQAAQSTPGNITVQHINAGTGCISLSTADGEILDGGDTDVDLVASAIGLSATAGIGNGNALETETSLLGAITTSGSILIHNLTSALEIGTACGVAGARITGGSLGDDIVISSDGAVTVTQLVQNTGGGDITLAANGNASTDDLTLQANVETTGGAGHIQLLAGDSIDLQGTNAVLASDAGTIQVLASTNFNHGTGLTNGTATGSITMGDGSVIGSDAGMVTLSAPGDIQLSLVTADHDLTGPSGNLVITADFDGVEGGLSDNSGAIIDGLTGETPNLVGSDAQLSAATGIGHADNLQTDLDTVTATNTTSGKIQFEEVATALDTALSLTQIANEASDIVVSTADGDLTATGSVKIVTGTGDIKLSANDSGGSGDGILTIQNEVTTANGAIELVSAADDVRLDATAAVSTTTGKITVTAATSPDGGAIFMADGATISSSTVEMVAQGDITLGSVSATSSSDTAVVITAQNGGAVIDGGDSTGDDITAANGRLVITADNGIGDGNPLEISVKSLDLQNLTSGKVEIDAQQSLNVVQAIQSSTELLDLTVEGTLTILTAPLATPNVSTTSGALNLTATGTNGRIVVNGDVASNNGPIDLDAEQDIEIGGSVVSTDGSINLNAGTDVDISGTVTTNTGTLDITTIGGILLQDGGTISTIDATGTITLDAGATAEISGEVTSTNGEINLTAKDKLSLGSTGNIQTATGDITLKSIDDTVALDASVTSTGGQIDIQAGQDITLGVSDQIHSENSTVTLAADNDIEISGEVSSVGNAVSLTATNKISLASTGVIESENSTVTLKTTNSDIVLDGRVETQSQAIDIQSGQDITQASTGSILSDSGSVTIAAARDIELGGTNETTSGPIDLSATENITLTSTGTIATDSAAIDLSTTNGKIELQSSVESTSAPISLDAGSDVIMASTASMGTSAKIDVLAGNDITMSNGSTIASTGDEVILAADGDITIGQVSGTPQVSITSTAGAIIDGGDTGGADLTASRLLLRAATGIGSDNPLETNTTLLAATNSTSGSIQVSNSTGTNGTLIIGDVGQPEGGTLSGITNNATGTGSISITNAGALQIDSRVTDVEGGGIALVTTGTNNDLSINAAIHASNDQTSGGVVQLTTTGDLIIVDTGEADDIRGREVIGNATGDIVFDENSGVKIRSSTGAVVAPTPLLLNVTTPQVTSEGLATVNFDFGHVGAENFYIIVLWDPAFIDRTGTSPAILDGQPIFGIFNSTSTATTADFPPEFLAAFNTLVARANAVGPVPPNVIIDGYDQFAIQKMFSEGFAGLSSFTTTHTYLANPSKSVPYNPAEDIPMTVLLLDDGNITLTSGGTDLGQTEETSLAGVPGDGLQSATFVFDLSIEVPQLEAPRVTNVDTAEATVTTLVEQQDTEETQVLIESDSYSEQRIVILEKIAPDGTISRLPNGELMRREFYGTEGQELLNDLPDLFERLNEGHWRIYLQQGADSQPQLIRDIELRDGKPAGDDEGTQDRPPTSETEAQPINQEQAILESTEGLFMVEPENDFSEEITQPLSSEQYVAADPEERHQLDFLR